MGARRGVVIGVMAVVLVAACRLATGMWVIQEHCRWRKGDGAESSATWLQPPDTPHKVVPAQQVRLRFVIYNSLVYARYMLVGEVFTPPTKDRRSTVLLIR